MRAPRAAETTRSRRGPLLIGGLALAAAAAVGLATVARPGDPEALARAADAALRANRIPEAAAAVARLAESRPAPMPDDRMLTARVAMAQSRTDDALRDLAAIPDVHPMAAEARLRAGQLELRRDRARAAEKLLLESVRLDPKRVQARRELVYVYGMQLRREALGEQMRALSKLMPLKFSEVFLWCLTRKSNWEPLEAKRVLEGFLAADPDDRWSRLALADNLVALGQLDAAEAALSPLPAADAEARGARVRIALARDDSAAAEALLAAGPADDAELNRLRGRLALADRDPAAAAECFRKALATRPDDRDVLFGLGSALRLAGDADGAAPYLEAARLRDELSGLIEQAASPARQGEPGLFRKLGDASVAVGHLAEARAWYRLAVQDDPLDRDAQGALSRLESAPDSTPDP